MMLYSEKEHLALSFLYIVRGFARIRTFEGLSRYEFLSRFYTRIIMQFNPVQLSTSLNNEFVFIWKK